MITKPTLTQRLRYSFENTLSKGTPAIIMWLAILSILIVVIAAAFLALTGIKQAEGEDLNFVEAAWQSLMHTMDSGTLGGDSGWSFRIVMLFVTIGGIFILSSLIGTLTAGLESTLDEMRKGRSKVLESDHTLILGWSSKISSIISELMIANANQKKPRIVIMADKDKVEMEDEIRSKFPDTGHMKIICRTGSPLDLTDLEVVSPHDAKSIIILSPEEGNADTHVIKSILAITNNPKRKQGKYHIVAEIRNQENMEAAELVGADEAVIVLSGELIARVTAQTCRQSGLSVVYTELLDFDGAEIYFKKEENLYNKTYKEALFAYENSAVMGIYHANGDVSINPDMDKIIGQGDKIIAISEDDDTINLSGKTRFDIEISSIINEVQREQKKERTLILGWNQKGNSIIRELDNYVSQGSEILVVAELTEVAGILNILKPILKNTTVEFKKANTTEKSLLNSLPVDSYDHIIILCYEDMDIQEADAKTLITLLHLRNISETAKIDFSIVSEMLDVRNRELAEVTKADDFIVSDKLISLMLSQLSENRHLEKVFSTLFSSDGSEIYLRPIKHYVQPESSTNFYTILESAAAKGETAIGYRIESLSKETDQTYGIVVNPDKSKKVKWSAEDKIIVLAED
ncbi:MAG: potassium transporter TrkA [Bacteroidota bacterium]|jgi:voltage-gated potassium channel Kch|nr:potassium transporter TrkA [Bacteroidota bacterium]